MKDAVAEKLLRVELLMLIILLFHCNCTAAAILLPLMAGATLAENVHAVHFPPSPSPPPPPPLPPPPLPLPPPPAVPVGAVFDDDVDTIHQRADLEPVGSNHWSLIENPAIKRAFELTTDKEKKDPQIHFASILIFPEHLFSIYSLIFMFNSTCSTFPKNSTRKNRIWGQLHCNVQNYKL